MSATLTPFGLKPIYHPSGLDRAVPFTGTVTPPVSGAIYQFTPVQIAADGSLQVASADATGDKIYGVFGGVEYTDASGRRTVSKWFGNALGTATNVVAYVYTDPELVYEVQAEGAVNSSAVGREFNFSTTAGRTVTDGQIIGNGGLGQSTTAISATATAIGTQGQLQCVGLGREPFNSWGDSYTILQVKIANAKLVAPNPAAQ